MAPFEYLLKGMQGKCDMSVSRKGDINAYSLRRNGEPQARIIVREGEDKIMIQTSTAKIRLEDGLESVKQANHVMMAILLA